MESHFTHAIVKSSHSWVVKVSLDTRLVYTPRHQVLPTKGGDPQGQAKNRPEESLHTNLWALELPTFAGAPANPKKQHWQQQGTSAQMQGREAQGPAQQQDLLCSVPDTLPVWWHKQGGAQGEDREKRSCIVRGDEPLLGLS